MGEGANERYQKIIVDIQIKVAEKVRSVCCSAVATIKSFQYHVPSCAIKCNVYVTCVCLKDRRLENITLEFQIDHTVGKNLHGWKNDVDNGARVTEMCPDIKAFGI